MLTGSALRQGTSVQHCSYMLKGSVQRQGTTVHNGSYMLTESVQMQESMYSNVVICLQEVYRGREPVCTVEGLHFNTEYRVRVKAFSRAGESEYSRCIGMRTSEGMLNTVAVLVCEPRKVC